MQIKSWQIALVGMALFIITVPVSNLLTNRHRVFELYDTISEILAFYMYAFILAPFFVIPFFLILVLFILFLYRDRTRKIGACLSVILGFLISLLGILPSALNSDMPDILLLSGIFLVAAGIYYFKVEKNIIQI